MGGPEIMAWIAVAALTIFRVAMIVGVIALIVAIVRGVRASSAAAHTT